MTIGKDTESRIVDALEKSNEETRQHISAEMDSMRGEISALKVAWNRTVIMIDKLLGVFGIRR